MSYGLTLNPVEDKHCGGPEGLEEAVEFAMRTNTSGPWIPLRLTWRQSPDFEDYNNRRESIRGYEVEAHGVSWPSTSPVTQELTICGEDLLPANTSEVQFRWMNTANEPGGNDAWAIFNVTADYTDKNGDIFRIFDFRDTK